MSDFNLTEEEMVVMACLNETSPYHDSEYFAELMRSMGTVFGDMDKDSFTLYNSHLELLKSDTIITRAKFYGSIHSMSAPYPLVVGAVGPMSFSAVDLELTDQNGYLIKTIPIVTDEKKMKIRSCFNQYSQFCFYGIATYALKRKKRTKKINLTDLEFRFYIMDLEPAENLSEIVGIDKSVIAKAKTLIAKKQTRQNEILEYIKKEVCNCTGVVGLDKANLLDAAIEFAVLQSLSDNEIDGRSAKLHSLVIGPPAVGKGKLAEVIRNLNPIYKEAQAAKKSTAGLVGETRSENRKWHSSPGLIPLAHRGVFIMQEFHDVKNKDEILGIFSMVMEDGEVSDSTTAHFTHKALTSIHLDMNKMADIYWDENSKFTKSRYRELKKIGIPSQMLSRFDFIIDIPRDTARQMKVAKDIIKSSLDANSVKSKVEEIKSIVTVLRADYPNIDIPKDVKKYMNGKFDPLVKPASTIECFGDFPTRMSASLKKMVIATCRANARKIATNDDVDYAIKLLKHKIDFLMSVRPEGTDSGTKKGATDDSAEKIRVYFKGKDITLQDATRYVNSTRDVAISDRQVRRSLDGNFQKAKRGYWHID